MIQNLICIILLLVPFASSSQNDETTGGVMLVGRIISDETSIRRVNKYDKKRMEKLYKDMASFMDMSIEFIDLPADKDHFNPAGLEEHILKNMIERAERAKEKAKQAKQKDLTVYGFIQGLTHGMNFKNPKTKYPYAIIHPFRKSLKPIEVYSHTYSVESIYRKLYESRAFRHVSVWFNTCNTVSFPNLSDSLLRSGPRNITQSKPTRGQLLHQLFQHKKGVLISSSMYGQDSYGTESEGTFFTTALIEVLIEVTDRTIEPNWSEDYGLFIRLRKKVQNYAHKHKRQQTPMMGTNELKD